MYRLRLLIQTIPLARIRLRSRRPPAAICQLRLPRTRSAYRSSHSRRASRYGLLSMRTPHGENLELTHQSAVRWILRLSKFLAVGAGGTHARGGHEEISAVRELFCLA